MFNSQEIRKHGAIESFKHSHWKARKDALLSRVWGNVPCLKSFGDVDADSSQQRRSLGVREIPIDKITGSVGRQDDFDGRFRPLKKHLRDRWVSIAVHFQDAGWPPIEVFKVGEEYFVLDGHHRTSYARNTGMAFLEANIWEIQQQPVPREAAIVDVQKELFSQKELAEDIVIYDSMVCCCA